MSRRFAVCVLVTTVSSAKTIDAKKFFYVFYFGHVFLRFFDFFIFHFPDVFFIFKKRWQSSEHLQEFENQ